MAGAVQEKQQTYRIPKLIFRIVIFTLIFLPIISTVIWMFTPTREINLLILDKTVLNKKGNEHRSFNWVMKHHKYTMPGGEFHIVKRDYIGFFPLKDYQYYVDDLEKYTMDQIDSITWDLDAIYFTDTYGIYENEWFAESEDLEHSKLIYGGLTQRDAYMMLKMKEKDKLVLSEFNLIATPTGWRARKMIEDGFGINWTGWTGRYFVSLDTTVNPEIPKWVINLYQEQYQKGWPFKKSGIVFVHVTDKIVILENEYELDLEIPIIITPPLIAERFGVAQYMRYPFWFDITLAKGDSAVLSTYNIYTNEKGDSVLRANGIPKVFPAVIGYPDRHRFYYFCGDYADNPISFWAVRFAGIEYLSVFLYDNRDLSDRRKFFWNFYHPMIKTILDSYYEEKRSLGLLYVE
jgi:hypothetical protein